MEGILDPTRFGLGEGATAAWHACRELVKRIAVNTVSTHRFAEIPSQSTIQLPVEPREFSLMKHKGRCP